MTFLIRRLAAALAFAAGAAPAQETSTTPYAVLYQVLEPAQAIGKHDRLRAVEHIESKRPGVAPSDIRLTIRSRSGDRAVPVAPDGRLEFPVDAVLKAENPDVLTNQPKGSLTLTVTFEFKFADPQRVAWDELGAALEQARAAVAERAAGAQARVAGIEYRFAAGEDARVIIAGAGERLLMAAGDGRVIVMIDETVAKERPTLLASRKPSVILPFISK